MWLSRRSIKAHPRALVILVGIGAREVDATEADGANPDKKLRGMINNVGLTFSVGDTLPWFTINIEKDN